MHCDGQDAHSDGRGEENTGRHSTLLEEKGFCAQNHARWTTCNSCGRLCQVVEYRSQPPEQTIARNCGFNSSFVLGAIE